MTEPAGPRLLYVEDDPLILELGVTAFEDAGFVVAAFSSPGDALTALGAAETPFRAMVTDIDLGSQTDGWQIARHARERFPDLPIVYVSGGSSNDWAAQGVPGSVMIVKPYASAQLIVAVSSTMQGLEPR